MSNLVMVVVISFANVAFAELCGFSEHAGLFGAIIGVGYYASTTKGGAA